MLLDRIKKWIKQSKPIEPLSVEIVWRVEIEIGEEDSLIADLLIGDEQTEGPLDFTELQRCLNEDGVCFPWTCTCGEPGCAGYMKGVESHRNQGRITWKCLDFKQTYCFELEELKRAIAEGIERGKAILRQNPKVKILPDKNVVLFQNAVENSR